jgi:MoaA/NifB/PqqE/SkfB family radical SAM enzyme
MLDQIKGLHIEPTNMCTLKCPRCSRTQFIEQFPKRWTNKNLNLDNLKSFLDIDLTGKVISLCGNYGDPIYYDQLFEMIDFFKEKKCLIRLATNGSYKTKSWWQQLVSLLDKDDTIIFAIDGTPNNFTKYRINADWESIQWGIDTVTNSHVKSIWQYIPFSFNEDDIDQVNKLSKELGFDEFLVMPSDRWDGEYDWLKPNKHDTAIRSDSIVKWKNNPERNVEITAKCKIDNSQHFISADGFYMPCCFAGDHRFYYKTEFYKNQDLYDISKTTITKVLDNLKDFYSTLDDAKLNYCTFNCPKL